MPSSHAPIKKYNYERSLFRWVMSRHPEPFEKQGITTRTLERAPLAREAFYTSDWPGARALVQSSAESKYERTAFFDSIIARGLRNGTRFNIDHVTSDEKNKLGITLDRASGKFYLAAYGSARTRRSSTRRASQTSSEGDASEGQHAVVKEVSGLLASAIESAGDHADVQLIKSRTEAGSARGSKILTFSVSIQRRFPCSGAAAVAGAAAAAAAAGGGDSVSGAVDGVQSPVVMAHSPQAADAGGGKPSAAAVAPPRRRASACSVPGEVGARQVRDGSASPNNNHHQQQQQHQVKARGRPVSMLAGGGAEAVFAVQEAPKRQKSIAHAVFSSSLSQAKTEPRLSMGSGARGASEAGTRFGRALSADAGRTASATSNAQGLSYLPGHVSSLLRAQQHNPATSSAGGISAGQHYGRGAAAAPPPRSTGFSPERSSYSAMHTDFGQSSRMTAAAVAVTVSASPDAQSMGMAGSGNGGRGPVMSACSAPPSSSPWRSQRPVNMRGGDFPPARTTTVRSPEMEGVESGSAGAAGSGGNCGSMPPLSPQELQQEHQHQQFTGGNSSSFRHQAMTGSSSATMLGQESHQRQQQHPPTVSTLNAYTTRVKQQALSQGGVNGGNPHGGWGATAKIASSMGYTGEPLEENMDFLASFF